MLDRASSMTETPRVDVPPPPPGTPPSAESPERPIPVMAPPRKGANLRVLFVVIGFLGLLVVGLAAVNLRDNSCVDWQGVAEHQVAARAAEARGDTVTMFNEMSEAASGAGKEPEVNRHLAAANGYMFSGERRMANYELDAASAAIQASTYPQC